jgi:hypothetical protein
MTSMPMETTTEDLNESQESMFDTAAEFPGHDFVELPPNHAVEPDSHAHPQEGDHLLSEDGGQRHSNAEPAAASHHAEGSTHDAESATYPNADAPTPEATGMPLSSDDFSALEERVLRAVDLVRRERQAKIAAEERAEFQEARATTLEARVATMEAQALLLEDQLQQSQADGSLVEQLQQEVDALRQEREQIRGRVDRLLSQLDALEL